MCSFFFFGVISSCIPPFYFSCTLFVRFDIIIAYLLFLSFFSIFFLNTYPQLFSYAFGPELELITMHEMNDWIFRL
jgi:hypothetical protein